MTLELGISVISLAVKAISVMRLLRIDENTTAHIRSIHGGGSANAVCDRVESLEQERASQQEKKVRACCADAYRPGGGS